MAYTKVNPVELQPLTVANLNTFETQYDEFKAIVDTHNHDSRYYTKDECAARYFTSDSDGEGSGFDADKVDGYDASQIIAGAVPTNCIAIWSGSIGSIPSGWVLCDGTNGTPDLRDRFIIGVGTGYTKGQTGGDISITPTGTVDVADHALAINEIPRHLHTHRDYYNTTVSWTSDIAYHGYSDAQTEVSRSTGSAGGGEPHTHPGSFSGSPYDNRPAYYALCFIMRS